MNQILMISVIVGAVIATVMIVGLVILVVHDCRSNASEVHVRLIY